MALYYFKEDEIYVRLNELNEVEADVLNSLPIKAALH